MYSSRRKSSYIKRVASGKPGKLQVLQAVQQPEVGKLGQVGKMAKKKSFDANVATGVAHTRV